MLLSIGFLACVLALVCNTIVFVLTHSTLAIQETINYIMIRVATVSVMSPRSHQYKVMLHAITSTNQALLRTWQYHHSVSLSMVSKAARLALGCREVVVVAWVSVLVLLFDCFCCLLLQSSGLCRTH